MQCVIPFIGVPCQNENPTWRSFIPAALQRTLLRFFSLKLSKRQNIDPFKQFSLLNGL